MNLPFDDINLYLIPELKTVKQQELKGETKVLVLIKESDFEAYEDLLFKILKAIKLNPDTEVQFAQMGEEDSININQIYSETNTHVLSFGLRPNQIGFNASFRANHFYKTEYFSILLTHSLSQLDKDKDKKKALWLSLQSEFKS